MDKYHHGITIRQARERLKMTQSELAEVWPKDDGGVGVTVGYVHCIEVGKRYIESDHTKRELCNILQIEPWRFGLSDFDPFNPSYIPAKTKRLVDQTLEFAEHWIKRTEYLYRTAPLPEAAQDAKILHDLFEFIRAKQPPTIQQETQFLRLYTQVQNLDGIIALGYGEYANAMRTFREMYDTANQLQEPTWLAHALLTVGTELERAGEKEQAVKYLEQARDYSFDTSKNVAAYVHAYLARCYGAVKDINRFERAINTARNLAPKNYGDGTDFVYHPLSGILAEQSHGYLDVGKAEEALKMRQEITQQIERDNNHRLAAWIPLDWARAYSMIGEIEASVHEGREFLTRAQVMQSPHILNRVQTFANNLQQSYKDVQSVKEFVEEVNEVIPKIQDK
jgi:tetratricopeptide (TPR) repeat protein